MIKSSLSNHRQISPQILREELSLLQRKDQQIKRLQNELEQQRKRADNAVKMMENFKAIQQKYEQGGDTLRNQVTRRVKAEEEIRKLQARNNYLEEGIRKYLEQLKQPQREFIEEEKQQISLIERDE